MSVERDETEEPVVSRIVEGTLSSDPGDVLSWNVAVEVPVAFRFNKETLAVLVASPSDLEDFARGFALTEGIIEDGKEILSVSWSEKAPGIVVQVAIPEKRVERQGVRRRTRALVAGSSCGICGMTDFAAFEEDLVPVADSPLDLDSKLALAAIPKFMDLQTHKNINRSVHGAAFVRMTGEVVMVREDVGRHNALDKLIGGLMAAGYAPDDGFFLISSRCSYEMVQKVIRWRGRALVSLSAPTYLAIEMAAKARLTLATLSGDGALFWPRL